MLVYTEIYKGYLITARAASREIDLLMGKPYRYVVGVSRGTAPAFSVSVTATSAELEFEHPEDPNLVSNFGPNNVNEVTELGTRGYGFGIKGEVWERLRDVAVPEAKRLIDAGTYAQGKAYEVMLTGRVRTA